MKRKFQYLVSIWIVWTGDIVLLASFTLLINDFWLCFSCIYLMLKHFELINRFCNASCSFTGIPFSASIPSSSHLVESRSKSIGIGTTKPNERGTLLVWSKLSTLELCILFSVPNFQATFTRFLQLTYTQVLHLTFAIPEHPKTEVDSFNHKEIYIFLKPDLITSFFSFSLLRFHLYSCTNWRGDTIGSRDWGCYWRNCGCGQ